MSLPNGTLATPPGPISTPLSTGRPSLIERAEGQALIFEVTPTAASTAVLEALHVGDREDEWGEFVADCAKYDAVIASEIAKEKLTLAELNEGEQSLDRLRRWYREIRSRDVFGAPSQELAERRLKECAEVPEDFAIQVYEARQRP